MKNCEAFPPKGQSDCFHLCKKRCKTYMTFNLKDCLLSLKFAAFERDGVGFVFIFRYLLGQDWEDLSATITLMIFRHFSVVETLAISDGILTRNLICKIWNGWLKNTWRGCLSYFFKSNQCGVRSSAWVSCCFFISRTSVNALFFLKFIFR